MINELIEQIGGRERLEKIASWSDVYGRDASVMLPASEAEAMASALLAVLDAQEIPVAFYANDAYYYTESAALKDGAEEVMPLYTTPPAASVPDGWKLVPIEATPDMLDASWKLHGICHPSAYRTMIAAAPKPGGVDGDQS